MIIVAGTNRGLIEIVKRPNEPTTVKTWYLNTPITKVTRIGPNDFICLDFVSQRLIKITTTQEPQEIRNMTDDFQITTVKKPQRSDGIVLAPNVNQDESWLKVRVCDYWQLDERYFILSSKLQTWVWDSHQQQIAPKKYWDKMTDQEKVDQEKWSWAVSFAKKDDQNWGTLCLTQYTI